VFDKDYKNHTLPAFSAAQGVTGDIVYWALPRTFGAALTVRW
jgi:iron complex outermembrane receptor protein